jgi:hypothetical protein
MIKRFVLERHRGRTASDPTAPTQTPACDFPDRPPQKLSLVHDDQKIIFAIPYKEVDVEASLSRLAGTISLSHCQDRPRCCHSSGRSL